MRHLRQDPRSGAPGGGARGKRNGKGVIAMFADLRYAWRLVFREWRFSITLVATLATGIAASGAIFNIVNATMLRPLPIPDEGLVYRLRDYTENPGSQRVLRSNRMPNFMAIREEARSFDAVVGLYRVEWSMVDGDTPIPLKVILMSPGSLRLLGARVHAGRTFTADEESAGLDANVIILSHSIWQQRFGARPDAIGQTLRVEDRVVTVVGVLAPGFRFPYDGEAWMPLRPSPTSEVSVAVFARLANGVSRQQAQEELDGIAVRAESARPVANRGVRFAMTPLRDELMGDQHRTTTALMGAALLLLLLAVANVVNLLLVRGIRRSREIAVRMALGAERARQIRQMVIESLVFAAMGTAVGLAVALPISMSMTGLVPNTLRDQLGVTNTNVDWRAALFAAAVTGVAGVIAGAVPAWRTVRADAAIGLRHTSRGASGSHKLMHAFVIGEITIASVLLVCAGMMADNFRRLLDADLGLQPQDLLSIRVAVPPRYDTAERRITLSRQLLDAARAVPGTERAGIVTVNPIDRGSFGAAIESADQPLAPGQSAPVVNHRLVAGDWLRTAAVPLLQGRVFDGGDTSTSTPVAIVSRRLASRLWPQGDAVGKRVRQARPDAPWLTVVGVVADVRDTGEWHETWYVPYEQHAATLAGSTMHLMLRSPLDTAATINAIRRSVLSVDPLLPLPEPTVMTAMWEDAQVVQRMGALASTMFAISGLLLAALGTYGVLAYAVSARTREFGIRQALGATPWNVRALVVKDGAVLVLSGLAIGGVLGVAATRALRAVTTEAPGMPAALPWIVAAVLIAAAMVASLAPARRATAIEPADVMRSE
jgi:putative ABC transport system permease protein